MRFPTGTPTTGHNLYSLLSTGPERNLREFLTILPISVKPQVSGLDLRDFVRWAIRNRTELAGSGQAQSPKADRMVIVLAAR